MDIQSYKLSVIEKLMSVTKPTLLDKVSKLLDQEMIVGYTTDGKPLTKELYNKRLEFAEQQIQNGHYTSQEDLEKEAENW